MKRLLFKIGLFVCLWYEIAAELRLDGNTAFWVGLAVLVGLWVFVRVALQAIGLIGPYAFGLLMRSGLWLTLYWWMAPAWLAIQPWSYVVAALVLLVALGALSRRWIEREFVRHGEAIYRAYSAMTVLALLTTLGLAMWSMKTSGSLWPLIGYALLPVIPFHFGWGLITPRGPERSDARMGDEKSFRRAGFSRDV
jgi:hypothetical protein